MYEIVGKTDETLGEVEDHDGHRLVLEQHPRKRDGEILSQILTAPHACVCLTYMSFESYLHADRQQIVVRMSSPPYQGSQKSLVNRTRTTVIRHADYTHVIFIGTNELTRVIQAITRYSIGAQIIGPTYQDPVAFDRVFEVRVLQISREAGFCRFSTVKACVPHRTVL